MDFFEGLNISRDAVGWAGFWSLGALRESWLETAGVDAAFCFRSFSLDSVSRFMVLGSLNFCSGATVFAVGRGKGFGSEMREAGLTVDGCILALKIFDFFPFCGTFC